MLRLASDLPRVLSRAGRTLSMAANIIAVFVLVFSLGPAVDARLFPIVSRQSIDMVERDATLACWRWAFWKNDRFSTLVEADLKISTPDGDLIDTAALVKDPRGVLRYIRAQRTSAGGGWRHRILCVDLERAQIAPETPITIRLTMIYETRLPWRVAQPAPAFTIPSVPLPAQ